MKDKVTCIITTYGNFDFTAATVWALRRFYPELRIILADGGSNEETIRRMQDLCLIENLELTVGFGHTSEECCNMASALVNTPYVLFMDNDCKVTAPGAIPLLLEALEADPSHACTGAYAVKVTDWERMKAFTGTVFTDHMEVDATARYFQLHRTKAFRDVEMFPTKEWFYPQMAEHFDPVAFKQGCQGDMTIGRYYQKYDYKVVTPKATIPCLHWRMAKATAQVGEEADASREVEAWYEEHSHNVRLDPRPLNNWRDA